MFIKRLYCLIGASVFFTAVPSIGDASLISHWKFDEQTGTTAFNSAGAINGDLNGTSIFDPAGGILGGAVQLERISGTNVDMGDNFMFGSVNFSVQAWIKTSPGNAELLAPVYKHQGGAYNGYFLAVNDISDGVPNAENRAHFYVTNGKTPASSTIVNDGLWHQLVGVYDVSNNQTRLYVDGALDATGPRNTMVSNTKPFLIHGEGWVDGVRIWDHALTLNEVNDQYDQTINPVPLPGAIWLLGSGFAGLAALRRRRNGNCV